MRILCSILFFKVLSTFAQNWQQLPDFPGTARDDAAAFSYYCKVYVGTGLQVGWSATNDWWQYDVVQYTWQQVASLPATPRQYSTAVAIDGTGYLFGGLDATAPLSELWAYDTAADEWNARTSLPAAGRYACASFTANGKLYIVGGLIAGGTALNELWEYDPTNDQWSQRSSLPGTPRHRATATRLNQWDNTQALVIGGADSAYVALDEVWKYTAPADQWEQMVSFPEARYGASSATHDGVVVMAGAVNDTTFRNDAYMGEAWAPFGELPSNRRGGVMGYSDCPGWFYVLYGTGIDDDFVRHNDWYMNGYGFSIPENGLAPLALYPNPAQDRLTLQLPSAWQQASLTITESSGRLVMTVPYQAGSALSILDLAPGMYAIAAEHNGQRVPGFFTKLP